MGRLTFPVLALLLLLHGGLALGQDADTGEAAEEQTASGDPPETEDTGPRVRRLGDVESDEFEMDLTVPRAVERDESANRLDLGDPELERRLQEALSILAIREGDQRATQEVLLVLDEVLDEAGRLTRRGDFDQATDLLNAVRSVDANKAGLSEAWQALAEARKVPAGVRPAPPESAYPEQDWSQEKIGSVRPENTYPLPNPSQAERLDQLLAMIAARPNNQAALAELGALLDDLLAQSRQAMTDGDFEKAALLLDAVRDVNPRKRGLGDALRLLNQSVEVQDWLAAAQAAEQAGALIEPRLDSAYYHYRRVLSVAPDNPQALAGLEMIQQVMVDNALDAAQNLDFELAEAWLDEASGIQDSQVIVNQGRQDIQAFRDGMAGDIENQVVTAINRGDNNLAEFLLIDLIALGGYEDRVSALRETMTREESYGQYEPGEVIQDAFQDGSGFAPAVVVVNSGSFIMGSRPGDDESVENEFPAHRVTFDRGFALGQQEVTVGQFATFVRATGYRTDAERRGQGSLWDEEMGQLVDRPRVNWRMDYAGNDAPQNLPVLHVSWNDAKAYADWLASSTGKNYRLPSEAEFEYAIRAGTRGQYWWGDGRPRERVENLAGSDDQSETGRRFSNSFRGYGDGHFGPAPVGSFEPNPFGLYDMAGNVSEWMQDCWHGSYARAPVTGEAWDNPGCDRRVVRGGYWASAPRQNRSATRMSAPVLLKAPQLGFRIARDLW